MKTKIAIALLVALMAAAAALIYIKQKRYHVIITQSQIDAALAEAFPLSKRHLVIFKITYSNPRAMLLEESDRVQVGLDATLNIGIGGEQKDLSGGCTVTAGLRYVPETREFFLADARFDRLEIEGIPEKHLELVTAVASRAAAEFIARKPIYRLEAKDAKTTAAKLLLRDVEVKGQAIHITLGL